MYVALLQFQDVLDIPESHASRERQTQVDFAIDLFERRAHRQQIGDDVIACVTTHREVAARPGGFERIARAGQHVGQRLGPDGDRIERHQRARGDRVEAARFDQRARQPRELEAFLVAPEELGDINAEPRQTVRRCCRDAVVDGHLHHVAQMQKTEPFIDERCGRVDAREQVHLGLDLLVAQRRQVRERGDASRCKRRVELAIRGFDIGGLRKARQNRAEQPNAFERGFDGGFIVRQMLLHVDLEFVDRRARDDRQVLAQERGDLFTGSVEIGVQDVTLHAQHAHFIGCGVGLRRAVRVQQRLHDVQIIQRGTDSDRFFRLTRRLQTDRGEHVGLVCIEFEKRARRLSAFDMVRHVERRLQRPRIEVSQQNARDAGVFDTALVFGRQRIRRLLHAVVSEGKARAVGYDEPCFERGLQTPRRLDAIAGIDQHECRTVEPSSHEREQPEHRLRRWRQARKPRHHQIDDVIRRFVLADTFQVPRPATRLAVVDDHPMFRQHEQQLLDEERVAAGFFVHHRRERKDMRGIGMKCVGEQGHDIRRIERPDSQRTHARAGIGQRIEERLEPWRAIHFVIAIRAD